MALKAREKILLIFVVIVIAIWAFDRFYYTPQSKRLSALKEEVKAADLKWKESALFTKRLETGETEVSRSEKAFKTFNERMLRGEEFRAFLNYLGKESDRLNMKMISLTSQEEEMAPPEGKKVNPPFQYKKVTIHVVLHSSFTALKAYLEEIEGLPFLVMVDDLQAERMGEMRRYLKVTVGLSVYVIS